MLNSFNYSNMQRNNGKIIGNTNNTVLFSGKKYVEQSLFGEKMLIPREVHDAKESSRIFDGELKSGKDIVGNAVYLGDNQFLTVNHFFEIPDPNSSSSIISREFNTKGIGKIYNSSNKKPVFIENKIKDVINDYGFDLAIAKVEDKEKNALPNPIKIAKYPPYKGETVYIIGKKMPLDGIKAIPAVFEQQVLNTTRWDRKTGLKSSYSLIKSDLLEKNGLTAKGFSGSPVVNKKGELVGIFAQGFEKYPEFKFMVDLNTIVPFLTKNKIILNDKTN